MSQAPQPTSPRPSGPSRANRPSPARLPPVGEWARREPTGGLLLLAATVAALVAANTPLADGYASLRDFTIGPAALDLDLSVGAWAADGLLAVFFFVVGLELKRELVAGSLRSPAQAIVPVAAAVGGVVMPVLVFLTVLTTFGAARDAYAGWAIPAATDIAFAVAVLAVVARNLPTALRTFLLTLAVVDDLIAICIIAFGYADGVRLDLLAAAALVIAAFAVVVRNQPRLAASLPTGLPVTALAVTLALVAWALVHASGVHATVAGVALGLVVPVFQNPTRPSSPRGVAAAASLGPAARIEHVLQPWSACVAVPVFAFFAAGVTVGGFAGLVGAAASPIAVGIILALVLGKSVGIVGATWLVTRLRGVHLDPALRWPHLVGVSALGGIGFTVSLLVGELAYGTGNALADEAKVGVLLGSLTATLIAALVLRTTSPTRPDSTPTAPVTEQPVD
jgi:NhaA family Na+:H+ antiporter